MAKLTKEQLLTRSWETQTAAIKDLKLARVPASGDDYVLGQTSSGSWQLLDRATDVPAAPLVVVATRKSAAKAS